MDSEADLIVFYQNVRGLRTKTLDFFDAVLTESYPVIIATETWLHDAISSSEIFDDRYIVYRNDRSSRTSSRERGGGVLIAVLRSLCSCEIVTSGSSIEELWVRIRAPNADIVLCAVYIPPSSNISLYNDFCKHAEEVIESSQLSKVCITGDFNLPRIKWNHSNEDGIDDNVHGETENVFCDFLSFSGLNQFNLVNNVNNVILDLVLSNSSHTSVMEAPPLVPVDSHHPPLMITFRNTKFKVLKSQTYFKYHFEQAPYNLINDALANISWNCIDSLNVNLCVDKFYDLLLV